jgi:hypothetical protein
MRLFFFLRFRFALFLEVDSNHPSPGREYRSSDHSALDCSTISTPKTVFKNQAKNHWMTNLAVGLMDGWMDGWMKTGKRDFLEQYKNELRLFLELQKPQQDGQLL